MILKTVGVISLSFLIGLTFLYIVNEWYLSNYNEEKKNILRINQLDPEEEKIFFLGNSRTGRLHLGHIQNILEKNDVDTKIYSFIKTASKPSERLDLLEPIIKSKPNIVIIGVDILDVSYWVSELELVSEQKNNPLPNPQNSFKNFFESNDLFPINTLNFKNPKLTSLKIIDLTFPEKKSKPARIFNTTHIANDEEMKFFKKTVPQYTYKKHVPTINNYQSESLEKIINELSENNIDTIIFVTPRPEIFIETIKQKEIENFLLLLDNLHEKTDVSIYSFFDKYSKMEIFMDPSHVGDSPEGLIFSEDVARIILSELKQ